MAKKKKKKSKTSKSRRPTSKSPSRRHSSKRASPAKKAAVRSKARSAPASAATPSAPPPPGSFVWHELMTTDVARCRNFYGKLFGWKTTETEMMPEFLYTMFENKKQSIAGMMPITAAHGDMKPHWDTYVSVRDVDAIAQQCEALGGEVAIPPHDIPVGRWAMLKDPTGAMFAIYKAKKR